MLDLQLCSSIDSSHMLQNALRRLFRLAMRGVQRQGVWVWRFEHLEFLEIPQDRGQVDVLEPRSAFRGILALAYHLGVAGQPHWEKSGFSLFSQSLDPAEQRLVLWGFASSTFVNTKLSSGGQKSRMTVKTALRIVSICCPAPCGNGNV